MHLLDKLFHWMMLSGTMFFAAAAVVPELGGSDASGNDNTGDGGTDGKFGTESPGESDIGTDDGGDAFSEAGELTGNEKGASSKPGTDGKVDGRTLPPKVKEVLEQLKAADPKAHGFLKDVLFRDRAFKQEFPGGLAEAKKLKETLSSLPEGGLEAIQAEKAEWDSIDQAYNAADPRFLDIMVEANPQSFNKLAPAMIQKFAQVDPDGYQRHMAGVFVSTLMNSGISANLRFLGRALEMGDKDTGKTILDEITGWITSLDNTAKSQPKAPERNPELDAREQRVKEAEDKQWVDHTAGEVNSFKTSAIKKELSQYLKGQQLDDDTYEALENQALKYLNNILLADPQFSKTFNAYCENKDRDGVVRYMKSKLQELLPSKPGKPGPVEKAYKLFFRGATPPKPRLAAGAPKPAAPPAPAGWEKVGKAPQPFDIDMGKSSFEMRFQKAAVLKSGKKVFWGDKAPA